jgi:hypothetical protein
MTHTPTLRDFRVNDLRKRACDDDSPTHDRSRSKKSSDKAWYVPSRLLRILNYSCNWPAGRMTSLSAFRLAREVGANCDSFPDGCPAVCTHKMSISHGIRTVTSSGARARQCEHSARRHVRQRKSSIAGKLPDMDDCERRLSMSLATTCRPQPISCGVRLSGA